MATIDISRVSTSSSGAETGYYTISGQASLSSDGNLVVFNSNAYTLTGNDLNNSYDIFVKNISTDEVTLASTSASAVQSDAISSAPSISSDGKYVVFTSYASNLVVDDTNGKDDVFVKNLSTGGIQRVSVDASGTQANNDSFRASFSPDGKYVLFESLATNLVADDINGSYDVFLKNLSTGAVTLVSANTDSIEGNSISYNASFAANGQYVVFESTANNLVVEDTNNAFDIFVKNLKTGAIQLASISDEGVQSNVGSQGASISADGRYVAFSGSSATLVSGTLTNTGDMLVKDLTTGATQFVSTDAHGIQGNQSSKNSTISADGRYVAFTSNATNLVDSDTNNKSDVFIKELATGAIQRVSTSAAGIEGDNYSDTDISKFSADGKYLVFSSGASNLVAGDTNNAYDIFRVVNPFWISGGNSTSIDSDVSYTLADGELDLTLTGIKPTNGTGNALDNHLTGNSSKNTLVGLGGADNIDGGAGNDRLIGGKGNDILKGGAGKDTFIFNSVLKSNVDKINDFKPIDDTIQLENAVFSKLVQNGTLNAKMFKIGAAADGNDYLIYNPVNGHLSYDSDGNGSGSAVQIALLGTHLALTNADFAII